MLSGTSIGSKAAALVTIVLLSTAGIIAVDLVGYERRFLLEEGEEPIVDQLSETATLLRYIADSLREEID